MSLTIFRPGKRLKSSLIACSLIALITTAQAEDLTNASIPAIMDGGSSTYTVDAYGLVWGSGTSVSVGSTTSGNALTIQNGGTAASDAPRNGFAAIGSGANASLNTALVTGAGSSWTITGATGSSFAVGQSGHHNSLTISDGGLVSDATGTIGAGSLSNVALGHYNSAIVTGVGSLWTNSGQLNVGPYGSYNSLTVDDGGAISANTSVIGSGSTTYTTHGNYNSVSVSGAFTTYSTTGRTTVGNYGSNNSLTVSDTATGSSSELVVGGGHLSSPGFGSSNSVVLDGAETSWSVTNFIRLGVLGSANSIEVKNGALLSNEDTVYTSSPIKTTIGAGSLSNASLGNANTGTVTGAGSQWKNIGTFVLGDYGSGNKLTVSAGGTFTNENTVLGAKIDEIGGIVSGSNNEVLVTGIDSTWASTGSVNIGTEGNAGNSVTVADHGLALIGDGVEDVLTVAANNYVRLDGGYIALFGDQQGALTALITGGAVQVLRDDVWVAASLADLNLAYFVEGADTSEFTGGHYDNLGGYTLVTSAVPEPSTWALVGLAAGALLLHRRNGLKARRRNS